MYIYAHAFSAIQPNTKSIPLLVIAYRGFFLFAVPIRPMDDIPLKNLRSVLVGQTGVLTNCGWVYLNSRSCNIVNITNLMYIKDTYRPYLIPFYPFSITQPLGFEKNLSHSAPPMISPSVTAIPLPYQNNLHTTVCRPLCRLFLLFPRILNI